MEENVRSNSSSAENVNITAVNSGQQADSGQPSDYEDASENLEEVEQYIGVGMDGGAEVEEEMLARMEEAVAAEAEMIEQLAEAEAEAEMIEQIAEADAAEAEFIEQRAEADAAEAEFIEQRAEADAAEAEFIEHRAEADAAEAEMIEQMADAEAEMMEQMAEPEDERIRNRLANAEQAQELHHVDYDIAIPSQHSYLDMNLTRVEGYNYWLEGQQVNLYMIPLDVIVIPGQTLPLRIRENTLQFVMVRALLDTRQKTFGAVYLPAEREQVLLGRSWSQCGVTVQILEISDETPSEIVLKCKGRQRFKTISTQRRSVLTLHAKVQILADHIPPRLYDPLGRLRDPFKFSSHPAWFYKLHDVYSIVNSIKKEITKYSPLVKVDVAPTQPDMFSYWLISAMPFKFNQRVKMLRENSLVVRLKSQLDHIKELNKFDYCCQTCGTDIVSSNHLVSMSADGPFFVNPAGIAFELITAYSVQHTVAQGRPVTKDSWFPGYAWNFLCCLQCESFLGWKFTAVVKDTQPQVFYGIQRKAVRVLRHSETDSEDGASTESSGLERSRIIYNLEGNFAADD